MFSVGSRRHLSRIAGAIAAGFTALAVSVAGAPDGWASGAAQRAAGAPAARGAKGANANESDAKKSADAKAPAGRSGKASGADPKAATAASGDKKSKPVIVAGIRCRHGVLEDPHRGFVRCLAPDEKDAKWLPPAPQPEPVAAPPKAPPAPLVVAPTPAPSSTPSSVPPSAPSPTPSSATSPPFTVPPAPPAVASAAPPSSSSAPAASASAPAAPPPKPTAPPEVEVKPPTFESGDVPGAEKSLTKLSDSIAKCVADNGGLSKPTGTLKIQFLVRARGRMEGVEVLSSQGISPEGAACVRQFLKNRSVGHPTSDPVGVTVILNFKPSAK